VGQQKLVSTLAVAQAQIVELRSAAVEKDRAIMQLRHDMQHSVSLFGSLYRASYSCLHSEYGKDNTRIVRNKYGNEYPIQLSRKVLAS
jgi:hypothetical protein